MSLPKIGIIGAGLAGLTCATQLQNTGYEVILYDKSRSVSGRLSTRRVETNSPLSFDHGAQYFTVDEQPFEQQVRQWLNQGVVRMWEGRFRVWNGEHAIPLTDQRQRFVGVPGMSAICKSLAKSLNVVNDHELIEIDSTQDRHQLKFANGMTATCDLVVLTLPAPQAGVLLGPEHVLHSQINEVQMSGCWAAMLSTAQPLPTEFDGMFVNEGPIRWIARNSSKPGRSDKSETWVLHASPEWSEQNLELRPDQALSQLQDAFEKILNRPLGQLEHANVHRWRYAKPEEPLTIAGFLWDENQKLALAGDWCHGGRVEGAWMSGYKLAGHIEQLYQ